MSTTRALCSCGGLGGRIPRGVLSDHRVWWFVGCEGWLRWAGRTGLAGGLRCVCGGRTVFTRGSCNRRNDTMITCGSYKRRNDTWPQLPRGGLALQNRGFVRACCQRGPVLGGAWGGAGAHRCQGRSGAGERACAPLLVSQFRGARQLLPASSFPPPPRPFPSWGSAFLKSCPVVGGWPGGSLSCAA